MSAAEQHTATMIWRHECPFVGAVIDEHDPRILDCRCFVGRSFLAAQDAMAVQLDSIRVPGDQ